MAPRGQPADLGTGSRTARGAESPPPVTARRTPELLERLAIAIAGGQTVRAWARSQSPEVPRRTAYRWSRRPEVVAMVRRIRRRAVDRAIGCLTKAATRAARKLGELCEKGDSHSIQLQASRAVLADLMAVADHHDFEDRLAALERRADAPEPAPAHDPGATA
jgi:hypothetical protein